MLIGQLLVGPTSTTTAYAGGLTPWKPLSRRKRSDSFWVSAMFNNNNRSKKQKNHYSVLGVSSSASSADIKKAYRLLARKWHPDVSKDSRAGEVFKNIHLAYQVLSNEATRVQYDRVLKGDEYTSDPLRRNTYYDSEFEDEIRLHRWDELKRKMRNHRYQSYNKRYNSGVENSSFQVESDDEDSDDEAEEERGSFFEVLQFAVLSIFIMQTAGCQISLLFSSLLAWFDGKLDAGYKLGYLIAFVLGGRGGVMLSLCLSFATWACGKNSSSLVAVVVVAMWVGSNVMSYAPFPQGALLALLCMSIKLQIDLN